MTNTQDLLGRRCRHLETALDDARVQQYLAAVDGWSLDSGKIVKTYAFKNYHETLAFVNAAAWIFHAEDHHPKLVVTYNRCTVKFDTHSVNGGRGGISENDFICAAKVDALFQQAAR